MKKAGAIRLFCAPGARACCLPPNDNDLNVSIILSVKLVFKLFLINKRLVFLM